MPDFPKAALWRGRKVRVLYYLGEEKFRILDRDDAQWTVKRDSVQFL